MKEVYRVEKRGEKMKEGNKKKYRESGYKKKENEWKNKGEWRE